MKLPGAKRREHLREGSLVLVGHRAIGEDVEVAAVPRLAGACRLGPRVFAGDVVEHEVETEADAVAAGGRRQRLQVVDRPEVGADGAVVGDGVAAVVGARAAVAAAASGGGRSRPAPPGTAGARRRPAGHRRTGRCRRRTRASAGAGTSPVRAGAAGRSRLSSPSRSTNPAAADSTSRRPRTATMSGGNTSSNPARRSGHQRTNRAPNISASWSGRRRRWVAAASTNLVGHRHRHRALTAGK